MAEKKYVIRHKGVPKLLYPYSQGDWYYCSKDTNIFWGTWRHKTRLSNLIIGPLDKINERYNRITTSIYKENVLEIVELTQDLSEEFLFIKLAS